jgi:sulfite exporter TauE/SafE
MSAAIWLTSGLKLGIASSLHCAAMCGAIASSFLMATRPATDATARLSPLLAAQAGRIAGYVLAGALVGQSGAAMMGLLDRAELYRVLQYAATITLIWIGLSVAGLLPSLGRIDRVLRPVGQGVQRLQASMSGAGLASPFGAGLLWGMMPCGMVYAALFSALLTGRMEGGLLLMLGFGFGTLPAVTASALGISQFRVLAAHAEARTTIGLLIAGIGVTSLWVSGPGGPLCVTAR